MTSSVSPAVAVAPELTRSGRAVIAGAMIGLFVAATSGQPAVLGAAALLLGLVCASLAGGVQRSHASRALSTKIDLPEGADCARGSLLAVAIEVSYSGDVPLRQATFALKGEGCSPVPPLAVSLPPRCTGRALFTVDFPRAGRWRLHGVDVRIRGPLGLSEIALYRPCEAPVKVRPRPIARRQVNALTSGIGIERDRAGRFLSRRLGAGLELRELRDYVPGDPLKSVAWRATARRQRPLVRAFEEETIRRIQILLDIGPTMRAGAPGETPLDRAIDVAAGLSRHLSRERVGLTTYDHRVYAHFKPRAGVAHLQRRLGHLLELHRVVDADLTEICDAEVMALVGAFLEAQEGLDLRQPWMISQRHRATRTLVDPLAEIYDIGALYGHVRRFLAAAPGQGAGIRPLSADAQGDTVATQMRVFCALRGLTLPYRLTGPVHGPEDGLVAALGLGLVPGAADHWIVLSDLRGVGEDSPVFKALRAATVRKKRVLVVPLGPIPAETRARLRAGGARLLPHLG